MEITNQKLYQSDTWGWEEELSDYPASEYTLNIYLKKASGTAIQLTASASGDTHVLAYSAANSANATPGVYSYQAKVTETATSEVTTIETGKIEIYKDLATVTDERSWIQKAIDEIESILPTALSREAGEITIAGRTIKYISRIDLIKQYEKLKLMLKNEENKEKIKNGFNAGGKIKVEFR